MDVNAYLNRINFVGDLDVSYDILKKLQQCHLLHVPFENLDIHRNIQITLDIERIFNKIVKNNRGGFCYELNGLFFELLTELGFDAFRISAQVYDKVKGYGPEFDHMAIIVNLNGKQYLVDVGFGAFAFAPLEIKIGEEVSDELKSYIFESIEEKMVLVSTIDDNNYIPNYKFKIQSRNYSDFKEVCKYHQTSELSHFTSKRLISMFTTTGRSTITDRLLKITKNGEIYEESLDNDSTYKNALKQYFNVVL